MNNSSDSENTIPLVVVGVNSSSFHDTLFKAGRNLGKQKVNFLMADKFVHDFDKGLDLFTLYNILPIETRMKVNKNTAFINEVNRILIKRHVLAGSSEELQLQKEITKYPHRADLKLRLMELQKNQKNLPRNKPSKKKRKNKK